MWINVVEEMDNRDPKGDKVPLMESVFKEFDSVRFNVSSGSLHSNLKGLHSYYWKETLRSLSQKGSLYLLSSHTQFSHWIRQLAIWRDTLSSSIYSLIPQTDSFIESHIYPRSRHWLNQTFCVSFVSRCMDFQFSTLTSVKRTLTVSKVLPTYIVKSKNRIQAGQLTANVMFHNTHKLILTNPNRPQCYGTQSALFPTPTKHRTHVGDPSSTSKSSCLSLRQPE